ncbi:PspC domain-containing protein [Thalassorhabdus alkalitolerans]|uniref:PspC domain-containing protein n=1 Tax=Thalassorhabdus alkalitolerans TaxID=2282697 RepID=A0ABW0YIN0_9BACI|nr:MULTISPECIES: PspC domain-containing protein [Bacillaceae]
MKKLYRTREDRKIAGVCGGLAAYFGIDATIVRVLTVVLAIVTSGVPFLLGYLLLVFLMPNEEDATF